MEKFKSKVDRRVKLSKTKEYVFIFQLKLITDCILVGFCDIKSRERAVRPIWSSVLLIHDEF